MDLSRSSGDEGNIAFKSGDMNERDVVNQPYTKFHFEDEWHFREERSCLPGVFGM